MLRNRLTRRGLALSGATFATILGHSSATAAVGGPLVITTVKAASAFTAGAATAGAITASVGTLATGVIGTMGYTKMKIATALMVTVGLAAGGAGTVGYYQMGETGGSEVVAGEAEKSEEVRRPVVSEDLRKLQGTWEVISAEDDGKAVSEEEIKATQMRFEFKRRNFALVGIPAPLGKKKLRILEGYFTLNPTQTPRTIDIKGRLAGEDRLRNLLGIYKLDEATLTICMGPERPAKFMTRPRPEPGEDQDEWNGLGDRLYVLKKINSEFNDPNPTADKKNPWKKTLPNSVTVELMGVSEHPSGPGTWWRPDGTRMSEAPYDDARHKVSNRFAEFTEPKLHPREFAVSVTSAEDFSIKWELRSRVHDLSNQTPPLKDWRELPNVRTRATFFPIDEKSTSVGVGIASGPWKKLASKNTDPPGTENATIEVKKFTITSEGPATGNRTNATVLYEYIDRDETRIVAIDNQGKVHHPSTGGAIGGDNLREQTAIFDMPLDQIKEFQLQGRKYHWAKFEDVALQPKATVEQAGQNAELEKLQGVWSLVSAKVSTKDGPADMNVSELGIQWVVVGSIFSFKSTLDAHVSKLFTRNWFELSLGANAPHKQIDLPQFYLPKLPDRGPKPGLKVFEWAKAIYKVEREQLTVNIGKDRPKGFDIRADAQSGQALLVFKRKAKSAGKPLTLAGEVTIDGKKPLPFARVSFVSPDPGSKARRSAFFKRTDSKGRFRLQIVDPRTTGEKLSAFYNVTVSTGRVVDGAWTGEQLPLYSDLNSTPIRYEFVEDASPEELQNIKIEIDSKHLVNPWLKTLPNGVTVELVGVSEHPSGPGTWWRPDGAALKDAPYEKTGNRVYPDANEAGREFAVRVDNLPNGKPLYRWKIEPAGSSTSISNLRKDGRPVPHLRMVATTVPKTARDSIVRFGVAAEPWVTREISKGGAESGGDVVFAEAVSTGTGTVLTVAHGISDDACRIVALDSKGNIHTARKSTLGVAGTIHQITAEFNLALGNIEEFQFQTCKYHWAEFKNVAHYPRGK